ncbi:16S rRNA (adenine(1518)-N(6)/adenine(1519)-N(6))-dimethyltransferase RsmA [Halodesulfovibrio sp. MK-HDV]|jgi:16S rRNA (adenine1518-N6/adenine1519-N6)-dimethyltransferase|uniref:16S rRNA (adenine(1518)-N(6)/adenine(1519)-N(6))- dimethyltransferase RsmA n=1 Tax=unclassified Halodesulfovibrio TaxID=2644657 RepID=UPI00136CF4A0|nr:16S rRNA (adenine(1518)-N(6)/adenine(1519)-N(6))-dimethyltransferase RsmA [Halodesulfovibrio sp. MK-HDV]KAF1077558.1 Ribosomal RNA small subunit methyltransferase A [Halodesulfovibrio sp. MK-HDV]
MALDIKQGPRAKKSLGQNFLQDKNTANRIVDALRIEAEDHVIEIGPGPGALTHLIHNRKPAWFTILEKDYHWAHEHKRLPPAGDPELQVVLTDALLFPWENLTPEKPWKIIGNLPYNIASPLMWDILSKSTGLKRAVFMIQKEVGDRIVAAPSSKQYGALSVWLQSYSKPKREFIVPPGVFLPRPKVDSAVLSFVPTPAEERDFDPDALSWLLKVTFQQRRKQLQKILKGCVASGADEAFEKAGVQGSARPETLTTRQFQILADALKSCPKK